MPDGTLVDMPDDLTPELAARLKALQAASAPAIAQPSAKAVADQQALKESLDTDNKSQLVNSLTRGAKVALNSANKGIAAIPDAVLNTPNNLLNLGRALYGYGISAAGRPDLAPDVTENPNIANRALSKIGAIRPELEPQSRSERLLDSAVQGGVGMAIAPANSVRQLATNVAIGGASGLASGGAGEVADKLGLSDSAKNALSIAAGAATPAAAGKVIQSAQNKVQAQAEKKNLNSTNDASIQTARDAGYVIPPSQSNPSSVIANTLDIVAGGRPKMAQAASAKNAEVTQRLAAKALGLPSDTPITKDLLQQVRNDAHTSGYVPVKSAGQVDVSPANQTGAAYHAALDAIEQPHINAAQSFPGAKISDVPNLVAGLRTDSFDAAHAVDQISLLRAAASKAYASGDTTLGKANRQAAVALEGALEDHLQVSGNPDALKGFQDARKLMAQTHAVEDALNKDTSAVSARKMAAQSNKGAPLSDGLDTAAKMGNLFRGKNVQDMAYSTPGGSQLEGVLAAGAAVKAQNPWLLGIPYARAGLRNVLLSDAVQSRMNSPNYDPNIVTRAVAAGAPQNMADMPIKSALSTIKPVSGALSQISDSANRDAQSHGLEAAQSRLPSPDELEKMPWIDVQTLRLKHRGDPYAQQLLAPYEHMAYAREQVAESPVKAAAWSAMPAGYQVFKGLGMDGKADDMTTPPSLDQATAGVRGVWQGMKQGLQK